MATRTNMHTAVWFGLIAAAMATMTLARSAEATSRHNNRHDHSVTVTVSERIDREVQGQCFYRGRIDGTVQVQGNTHVPDLRIRASVHCPSGVTVLPEWRMRGVRLSPVDFEQALEAAGTVRTYDDGEHCTYLPDVSVRRDGRVQTVGVTHACTVSFPMAVGGGPRDTRVAVPVREDFRRDLENGCEYRAKIRGVLRTVGTGTNGAVYQPDLRIQTEVHCPDVPVVRVLPRRIVGPPQTARALARRIASVATVITRQKGMRCVYIPTFEVRQGRTEGRTVRFECRDGEVVTGGVHVDRSFPVGPEAEGPPVFPESIVAGE